ncbi:hypothetical protein NUACC26_027200 [Scytonema sp. NUACC26]
MALGANGQVIIDVIPEVELIIGKQPPLADVGSAEVQNRFHHVFQSFLRVFASREHPLVIFLDDLQWADLATLKLIELMMTDAQMQYLFLIGAYRNNEVEKDDSLEAHDRLNRYGGAVHPLMMTVEKLRKQGAVVNSITLTPLTLEPIAQLIAETLHSDISTVKPFAELVLRKTDGNPFFVNEFLKTLYLENLIAFNYNALTATQLPNLTGVQGTAPVIPTFWHWDLVQIEAKGITDNVVELMIDKLKKLPAPTQQVLRLAACVGADFDLTTLSVIGEKPKSEIFQDLVAAVHLRVILPASELDEELLIQDFKFLHDRVQQAAYALIDDSKKQVVHLQIGRLLLQNCQPENLLDKIFKIVDHLNLGVMETPHNLSQKELDDIAKLNLIAGHKAKTATAYNAAVKYFKSGRSLLDFDGWRTNYGLTLALYESAAEVEYLCGNFTGMEQLASVIHYNAKTVFDEVKVYDVKIQAAASQGNLKQAIKIGLMVLEGLGVRLPEEPSPLDIQRELEKTSSLLAFQEITDLIHLREMTQAEPLAAMRILSSITSLTFIAAPNLFLLVSLSEVNLSIQYGNATLSPHGYVVYGIILCGIIGNIEAGYKFGRLALNLTKQLNSQEVKAKIYTTFCASVMHWQEHLKESVPILLESYQSAVETGSFEYVGYCGFHISEHLYFIGRELTGLEQEIAIYSQVIDRVRRESPLNWIAILWQSVLNLLGRAENPNCLIGVAYNEERSLSRAIEVNDRSEILFYYLNKLILTYLFGNYHHAVNNGIMAEQYLDGAIARVAVAIFYFYDSLAHLGAFVEASTPQKEVWMNRISLNQDKMQKWATYAPMNFQHKYDLVEAEKARVLEKILEAEELYERAIQGARDNEYLQEEALAYELAAKFYLARGRTKIARAYMIEAHYCYKCWGAKAKVVDLEAKYPELLAQLPSASRTLHSYVADQCSKEALDLATVMKASLAISGEMELQKLLSSLMKILIENAGAQTGCLILRSVNPLEPEGEWAIEASGEIDIKMGGKALATIVLQSIPIKNNLPVSIINYVVRTRESLVLNNATQEGHFTRDPYVQSHQPQSILCTPLINQGQLSGIVYLENNLTTGAFSADRLQVIQLLSGQAAISITNAKLYAEVTEQKSQLTQFINAMPVGVIVHDVSGRTTYANQKAMELCNINTLPEAKIEQLAQTYQAYIAGTKELYPTELLPTVRSLAGETVQVDDMELHHPSKIISLEVSSTPIFDKTGKIAHAIAAFQDITQRKQAQKLLADYNQTLEQQVIDRTLEIERKQEVLQEQKELLQTIFNNIPVMVALFDAQNNIKLVNRELEGVLGWS